MSGRFAAFVLLCLFVGALPAIADDPSLRSNRTYGAWHVGEIGGGGYLQQVVWAPSDAKRMYLTSDVGGCWRSDDGGESWRMLHGAFPADGGNYSLRGVAVDPRDADRVFFATDRGLWRSTDGGSTFRHVLGTRHDGNGDYRSDGRILLIHPQRPDTLFIAGMDDGFHSSTDGGDTWTQFGPRGINPVELHVDMQNPERIWMCCQPRKKDWKLEKDLDGGVFRSEDGGQSWSKISDVRIFELRQLPGDPQTLVGLERQQQVMRSSDGGASWSRFAEGLAPREKGDARADGIYAAIDAGPGFLILGAHGGNFYRLDAGETRWRKVFERDPELVEEGDWWGSLKRTYPHFGSALGWVQVNPHDSTHWAFTDWYALYQSHDSGATWRLTIDGIEMTVVHCVTQDPADPRRVHVGVADVGYFRSDNGGGLLRQNSNGISNNVKHIVACLGRPERMYATGPQNWEWHANQVFVSDDGGLSWRRPKMQGLPDMRERRCNTIAVHPERPDECYLTVSGRVEAGGGGIWISTDAGDSWRWIGDGLPTVDHLFRTGIWISGPEVAVSADDSLVAVSVDAGRVVRFDRGAERWQEIHLAGGVQGVIADPATRGRFWLAKKEAGLWRSDNGGVDWTRATERDAWHVSVDLNHPDRVAFNGADGIFLSTDAGATWRQLDRSLPYRHLRNVVCFAGNRLIVGTGGNGVAWIDLNR